MSYAGGAQGISTVGPGADFRHDYEYLATYGERSDRALCRLLDFRRQHTESDRREMTAGVEDHLDTLASRLFGSPYYRRILHRRGLSPRDLVSMKDLEGFPMLDRTTLGKMWRQLPVVDEESPSYQDAVLVRSSGSTGSPIQVVRDGYDLVHMWTMVRFWAQITGVELPKSPMVVLLCDLPSGLEYQSRLPTLGDGTLVRISTRQPEPRRRLLEADVDVLFSDPAGLHWLLSEEEVPRPRLVLSSAQYLSAQMRRELEDRVRAPVINYYASSETGPIAWECLQSLGKFHVLVPDMWVESVKEELVVTRLRPSIVPLLRYRMGDGGQVAFDACRCGYRGWTIRDFDGRRMCRFLRPDGQLVDAWKLARLFKHRALDGFRLTQLREECFRLELVGSGEVGETSMGGELARLLRRLGWPDPQIELEYVDELEVRGTKPEPFRTCITSPSDVDEQT